MSPGPERVPTLPEPFRPHLAAQAARPAPLSPLPLSQELQRAVEEIKSRTPVEDLVREYVPDLKKAGSLWQACCPFHDEKTPSFKVDARRGYWRCYGSCDEGGDQISFVMHHSNVEFMEAIEILGARVGVEIPRNTRREPERPDDPAYSVLARAADFFQRQLEGPGAAEARDYLASRGLSAETIDTFGLGWAPGDNALLNATRRRSVPVELLERCGLARRSDRGQPYDFFRRRLMIPIRDLNGRVVGFGARRLGEGEGPKYVNTPETDLFKKSRLIYGYDLSQPEARRARHLVLMEGYTDVMAAHQVGLYEVGAVLGTATTENHARLVRKAGPKRISLVFDGDEAGSRAARKALMGLLHMEVELHIVQLPGGQDPCDLLLGEGLEAFRAHLDAAPVWHQVLFPQARGLSGAALRDEVNELLDVIECVKTPVERASLRKLLAEAIDLSPEAIEAQHAQRSRRPGRGPQAAPEGDGASGPAQPAPAAPVGLDRQLQEVFADLVGALLLDASLTPLVQPHRDQCLDEGLQAVLDAILALYEDVEAEICAASVMTCLADHPAAALVAGLDDRARQAASAKELVDGALERLARRAHDRREKQLKAQITQLECELPGAGPEAAASLGKELNGLLIELRDLQRIIRGDS